MSGPFPALTCGFAEMSVRRLVERWESYATPPGGIVLRAATLAQEVPGDALSLPLNEDIGRKAAMVVNQALEPVHVSVWISDLD